MRGLLVMFTVVGVFNGRDAGFTFLIQYVTSSGYYDTKLLLASYFSK